MKPSEMTAITCRKPSRVLPALWPKAAKSDRAWVIPVSKRVAYRLDCTTKRWERTGPSLKRDEPEKGKGIASLVMAVDGIDKPDAKRRVCEALRTCGLWTGPEEEAKKPALSGVEQVLLKRHLRAGSLWMLRAAECGMPALRIAFCLHTMLSNSTKGKLLCMNDRELDVTASYTEFKQWGVSKSSANAAITKLVEARLLRRRNEGTGRNSSKYRLLVEEWYEPPERYSLRDGAKG